MTTTDGSPLVDMSTEEAWVESVWNGTVQLYSNPAVQDLCLALQDEEGVCIPTLFCVCFAAVAGLLPPRERIRSLIAGYDPARLEIATIRAQRRAARPPDGHISGKQVYEELKKHELIAERALMAALSAQLYREARPDLYTHVADDRAVHILLGDGPKPGAPALFQLLLAIRPLVRRPA